MASPPARRTLPSLFHLLHFWRPQTLITCAAGRGDNQWPGGNCRSLKLCTLVLCTSETTIPSMSWPQIQGCVYGVQRWHLHLGPHTNYSFNFSRNGGCIMCMGGSYRWCWGREGSGMLNLKAWKAPHCKHMYTRGSLPPSPIHIGQPKIARRPLCHTRGQQHYRDTW